MNMGDNRFPWDSRAVRENEDWLPQQRGMLAQQFVFGYAMGWMALEELDHWMTQARFAPDIAFFGTLARLRMASAKYLVHGSAYRPVTLKAATPSMVVPAAPICDWGDAFSTGTPRCCNTSVVLANAWQATDGGVGVALSNWGTFAVTVEASVQLPVDYASALVARSMGIAQDMEVLVTVGDNGVAKLVRTLEGRSATVLELTP